MIDLSPRRLRMFGVLSITVLTVSCGQPGVDGVLPTSPSSLSVGPSAGALGPGASYNATGMWRFVVTDAHGNVEESFDTFVSQDSSGNLSFLDGEGLPIRLERLGTGVIITYRQLSIVPPEDGGDCDVRIHATVRLDTRTNTISAALRLKELGCANQTLGAFVTGTKLS